MDNRLNMPQSVGQFTLKWQLEGQECRNVMYLQQESADLSDLLAFTAEDLKNAANVLADAYISAWIDKTASSAILYGVDAIGNTAVGAGPLITAAADTGALPQAGTNSPGVTANNVSLAVRFQTGIAGRGRQGRFYFVGIGPGIYNSTQPNQLKSASVSDFTAAGASFLAALTDSDSGSNKVTLAVCSFVTANTDRVPALVTRVTSVNLFDSTFDSQRRRLPGRGI